MGKLHALLRSALLCAGLLAACCWSAPAAEGLKTGYTLGVVLIDVTNQFFVDMIEGGDRAAADYGCTVIWKSADSNIDKQISLVENFIEQKVDCILVNPLDSEALIPVIEKAAAAGIPTITMAGWADVPTNYTTVYNDRENTRVVGELTGKLLNGKGKAALLFGNTGNLVSDLRQQGYHEGISKYPGITVLEQPAYWDPATGMKAAQDLIAANPDLDAIHSVSEAVTLAVYQAVKTAGKEGKILITSYDGNPDGLKAVERGQFYSTVLTGAKKTGYWNVKMGVLLASGARPKDHILNLDTHFVLREENIPKFKAMGIAPNMSVITPQKAESLVSQYREEMWDPDLLKK